MILQKKIGARIRALRQSQYPMLSIHRLAVMSEIDPGQLSRAERGLAGLSLVALERIAAALNISLGALVDPESNPAYHTAAEPAADAYDTYHQLIHGLVRLIQDKLSANDLKQCSDTEKVLIKHHIQAAIEEGIKRGHFLAEREIKEIRKLEKGSDPEHA